MALINMYLLLIASKEEARLENDQKKMCGCSSGPPVAKCMTGQGQDQWSEKDQTREERPKQNPKASDGNLEERVK